MRVGLRPDHEDVGDRRVADPRLGARDDIAAVDLARARRHAAGVGAGIGLGQAKTADPLAARQLRQIFPLLRLRAIGMDRVHHQARLDAHHRAITRVDALHLARDQAIGDIARADAAIFLRDGRAEQPQRAHLAEDRGVGMLVLERLDDARRQPVLSIGARGVAHHPLVVGQLVVEQERVRPVERAHARHHALLCR